MIRTTPNTMKRVMADLYIPHCSLSMHGASKNVNTGVQNMIAELFPNGTCLIALNIDKSKIPPRIPCRTVRFLTPAGPNSISGIPILDRVPWKTQTDNMRTN